MTGYVPLYDTMLSGTLYGRWPHTGIWACLLSRVSREGVIDETPQSLAAAIGVPIDTLVTCINDFMQPDPDSRSPEHEGRRLALISAHRTWGWRVLNHGKYREKARKKNYDDSRTESGGDASRKKVSRSSREVPRSPDVSREVPLSEAEANKSRKRATRLPDEFALTPERKAIAEREGVDPSRTFTKFCDYWRSVAKNNTKLDWEATWRTWCMNDSDRNAPKKKTESQWVR